MQAQEAITISVHCLAHCLNSLQDVAPKCVTLRNALDLLKEVSQLIRYSPQKRTLVFQQCKQDPFLELV